MLRNPGLRKSVEQPVLDLNFAESQIGSNAAPDSRIAFSRGSNAYFVDSDGLLKKSPHNLVTYSLFDADVPTNWTVGFGTGTFDHTLQPATGILSRFEKQILHEQTTSGRSYIGQNITPVAGLQHRVRCFFNPDETDADGTIFAITGTDVTGTLSATKNDIDPDTGEVSLDFVSSGGAAVNIRIGVGCFSSASGNAVFAGPQISQHTTLPVDNPYLKTTGSAVYAARLDHDASWFMSAAQEQNLLRYS